SQASIAFGLLLLGALEFQVKADQAVALRGVITANVYTNMAGDSLAELTGDAKLPSYRPDEVKTLPYCELWATGTTATPPQGGARSRATQFQGGGPSWPPAGITTTGTVAFVSGAPFDTHTDGDPMPAASPGVVLGPGNASITLHLSTLGLTNVSVNHTRAFTD